MNTGPFEQTSQEMPQQPPEVGVTLPLFPDDMPEPRASEAPGMGGGRGGGGRGGGGRGGGEGMDNASASASGHLQAARRLSKRMRRLPYHSAQQTRTGIEICRHLQALLRDRPMDKPAPQ